MGASNSGQSEPEERPPSLSRVGRSVGDAATAQGSSLLDVFTPRGAQPRSLSRRTAEAIQERIRGAHMRATTELRKPISHACLSIGGLFVVQGVRIAAFVHGEMPVSSVALLHALSASSDLSTICCCLPFILNNFTEGHCVRWGCVGPVVTLVLTMVLLDFIAMGAALVLQPFPVLPPHSGVFSLAFFQATLGAWNCSLVASFALQVSLTACCWRVYKGLRVAGLYPPNSDALERGTALPKHHEVSPLEMLCESEEVQLLQNFECQSESPFTNICSSSTAPKPDGYVKGKAPGVAELQISRCREEYAEAPGTIRREPPLVDVGRLAQGTSSGALKQGFSARTADVSGKKHIV